MWISSWAFRELCDRHDVVAAAAPRDRRGLRLVLEDRRLAAEERHEHVAGHRHRREARDVAGARRAVEEALLAQIGEREAGRVAGERRDDAAVHRTDDVHAQARGPEREHQEIAADASALAEVIDLRARVDAEPAVLRRVEALERRACVGHLRDGRRRPARHGAEGGEDDDESSGAGHRLRLNTGRVSEFRTLAPPHSVNKALHALHTMRGNLRNPRWQGGCSSAPHEEVRGAWGDGCGCC